MDWIDWHFLVGMGYGLLIALLVYVSLRYGALRRSEPRRKKDDG